MKLQLLIVLIIFLAIIKPVIADQGNSEVPTVTTSEDGETITTKENSGMTGMAKGDGMKLTAEPATFMKNPDGPIATENADGSTVRTMGDGTIITTYHDSLTISKLPDGTVITTYPDGMTVSKFPDNGTTFTQFPGGMTVSRSESDNKTEIKFPGGIKKTTTITEPPEDVGTTTTRVAGDTSDATKPRGKNLVPEGSTEKCSFTTGGGIKLITWITPDGTEMTTAGPFTFVKDWTGSKTKKNPGDLATHDSNDDGTTIYPEGHATIGDDGGPEYEDGETIVTPEGHATIGDDGGPEYEDGETIVTPEGHATIGDDGGLEYEDGETIVTPEGHATIGDDGGSGGSKFNDGDADARSTTMRYPNGPIVTRKRDGLVIVEDTDGSTTTIRRLIDGSIRANTVWPDGTTRESTTYANSHMSESTIQASNGEVYQVRKDGNGTIYTEMPDGTTIVTAPDGTISTVPSG